MTVSSSTSRVAYNGNGSTTAFAVPFYFLANSHVEVILQDSDGIETVQTLTTHYTVTGAGVESGGTVTMLTAPATGERLIIQRTAPATQTSDFPPNDRLPSATVEDALDKLTMLVQQVLGGYGIERVLKLFDGDIDGSGRYNGNGNRIADIADATDASDAATLGQVEALVAAGTYTPVTPGAFYVQRFSGDGATLSFTLSSAPPSLNSLEVFIDGVRQWAAADYTLSGTSLIFLSAPASGTNNIAARWGDLVDDTAGPTPAVINAADYGVTADGTTDDTTAAVAAIAAVAGTGATVMFPNGTVVLSGQIAVHQCKVVGDNTRFKFIGLDASTDCVVLQGSRSDVPLHFKGIYVDCNNCGRDGIVLAGGKTGSTQADFLRVEDVLVDNCVRDGIRFEPSAAYHWIEDFTFINVRVTEPGRHGIAMIQPNLSTTFINQGLFINCETRGAGQTTANGCDVYVEGQGTVSGQKISEITWINCEFDAASAPNHALSSFYLTMTGSVSDFDGWQWLGCTLEDVGNGVAGKTYAIFIAGSTVVRNPQVIGGVLAHYPGVIDPSKVSAARVAMSSTNVNMEMLGTDTKLRWGNGATDTLEWESAGFLKHTGSFKAASGFREGRTALTITAGAITAVRGFNKINLTSNITSITFPSGTADNLDGQIISFQFTQDGTGGRTVAGWPADVLLSGGSFTPTSTASKTSTLSFRYERGEAKWYETTRVLNI